MVPVLLMLACSGFPKPLVVGDPLPVEGEGVVLLWVFDANRCLGCTLEDPGRVVRRIRHRHGESLDLVVVAITEAPEEDRPIVEDFLKGMRVRTTRTEMWSRIEHASGFGYRAPEPAVYIGRGGVISHIELFPGEELIEHLSVP